MSTKISSKPTQISTIPFLGRVKLLTTNVRFVWWLGHAVATVSTLIYILKRPFSYSDSKPWYYLAYMGTLLSYGLALWKTYGIPLLDSTFFQKIINDENAQYFVMTIIWLLSSPVLITLIPFGAYSSFHVIDYIRTTMLPILFPTADKRGVSEQSIGAVKQFEDAYYEKCIGFISYIEVLGVMLILLKETFTLRISPLAVFFYGNFLRLRYATSPHIRHVFGQIRIRMDKWILSPTANPKIPAFVRSGYTFVRDGLITLQSRFATTTANEVK
ncbi:hypothetical protein K493DRAFT_375377 [Basidiobolus meristosporus CBS 931.73]|uniref:Tetra-spanning protein 1 n=1 Tax=Basidiobolus meristosporus CBS 931.73 TaxID=1314790 RepID=A0A1Y1Y6I6_9FUNG|nr:hypothetical protein K493DRAFT_375377 [Basidiobolus meristosporus CBS 931.73]|eukprot:ORX93326.1 hypothetical protein K493DRAFT_375377 [Basidiobolus meristosporus CBS 931.73]